MITIRELQEIRARNLERVRQDNKRTVLRIGVCMATGGLAAGARSVMDAIMEDAKADDLELQLVKKGCTGMCRLDPMVDVLIPGHAKVTYVKMDPGKIRRVMQEHIRGGQVVHEYTLHVANDVILNDYTRISG